MFRILFYCLGAFSTALGVVITINANLGVSPITSLPYVVSLVTKIDIGILFVVLFVFIIILQIVLLGKDFKWINLTQIFISSLFGYFVVVAEFIVGDFTLPSYPGRFLMLLTGNFLISLGVTMYVDAKLVPMPAEGLATALAQKLNRPFYQMKLTIDSGFALSALIISIAVFGRLYGLREGTIIGAVLIGWMIKFIQKAIKPVMNKLCFDQTSL